MAVFKLLALVYSLPIVIASATACAIVLLPSARPISTACGV